MEFLTPAEGLLFINGKPPKYEPECGFHDELCPQQPSTLNTSNYYHTNKLPLSNDLDLITVMKKCLRL